MIIRNRNRSLHITLDSNGKIYARSTDAAYTAALNSLVRALKEDYRKTGDSSGFEDSIDFLKSEYNRLP